MTESTESVVNISNVWKVFGEQADAAIKAIKDEGIGKAEVLERYGCVIGVQDATFDVPRGEIFCIMGLSGSGKSTLVRHINRLIEPSSGNIEVLGRNVSKLNESQLRELRANHIGMVFQHESQLRELRANHIGMVFQHMALLPHRSVRDNRGQATEGVIWRYAAAGRHCACAGLRPRSAANGRTLFRA
jgi:glycine betaine/proline transport system ATP-binding protein